MKKLSATLLLATMLAGCTVPNLTVQAPGTGKPGQKDDAKDPAAQLAKADKLNGIEFKPINADSARLVGTNGATNESAATPASSGGTAADSIFSKAAVMPGTSGPMGAPAPMSPAGSAFSGNMHSYYGYGGYFGGFGNSNEPMALVSMTGAELPGSSGSFQEILKSSVAPVVKDWAPDARLVMTNASVGSNGSPYATPSMDPMMKGGMAYPGGYYGEESGWRLTYISVSLNEVLNFTVGASKTSIIRMKYAPLSLNPELVQVDSTAAIKSLVAAIEDKSFQSEEEKTGKDYFLGIPFNTQNNGYFGPGNRIEVVYDVPENVRWNINLQQILGKLVWEMSFYAPEERYGYPMPVAMPAVAPVAVDAGVAEEGVSDAEEKPPMVMPSAQPMPPVYQDPGYHFNNSANGTIDAQTGAVIRFSRPFKNYYEVQKPYPYPYPEKGMPMPSPSPTPTTTPAPKQ